MRRKRRTKYYWLPTYGTPNASSGATFYSTSQQLNLAITQAGVVTGWTPIVVNDVPNDISEENYPLNDIIGNEYIVKRIVGKVPIAVQYELSTVTPAVVPPVVVGAGFYVARADRVTNNFNPVDSPAANDLYCPLNSSLQREPWIWRRTWVLGLDSPGVPLVSQDVAVPSNNLVASTENGVAFVGGNQSFPSNNARYGSVLDGPHIDAKTGRRVRQDEQLFFGFAAHTYPLAVALPATVPLISIDFHLDVRVLGALRRAKNRSNF